MVICNIVYDSDIEWNSEDGKAISKYINISAINCVTDITHIYTGVPTLFYGHDVTKKMVPDFDMKSRAINDLYCWSYLYSEIEFENWIEDFIKYATDKYFTFVENGIDVVFDEFSTEEFVEHFNPWPLIHEGAYEIYFADVRGKDIIIHSIKKDTLEYIGADVNVFLRHIYEMLEYRFLTIQSDKWSWKNNKCMDFPIFLDDLLYCHTDNWTGIDEIIDNFSHIKIDRKKVITYYLKQSEFLRDRFDSFI